MSSNCFAAHLSGDDCRCTNRLRIKGQDHRILGTHTNRWLLPITLLVAQVVGGFLADGIQIATAKSLAEGNNHRISGLSPPIVQTKYHFLFSLALAGIWAIAGSFPQNLPALKLIPLIVGSLWG